MPPPKVFIVDDEAAVRRALARVVSLAGYDVQTFESGEDFLALELSDQCGCVVLDVRMPGTGGLTVLELLKRRAITIPVIMLTGHGDVPMAVDAMSNGAFTFLQKPASAETLLENVAAAMERDRELRSSRELAIDFRQRRDLLTDREREVCDLVIAGKSTSSIAAILGNTESTVRVQRAALLKKLGFATTAELVHHAMTLGLTD